MAKERRPKQPNTPLKRTPSAPTISSGDESREMLSRWWHENGKYFVVGAVLAILAVGGWKGWGYYSETQAIEAADQYEKMLNSVASEEGLEASRILNTLRDQYTGTMYSVFASFTMAKFNVEQGQLEEAAANLRWITEHSEYEELKSLAWVRLARILLELGQREEAYDIVLSYSFPRGIEELAAEVQGDYLVGEGDFEQARDAYQKAISTSMLDDYNFIMMKTEEIGGKLEPPEKGKPKKRK